MAIIESLEQVDIDYEDGVEYGMTKDYNCSPVSDYDQIKPITPSWLGYHQVEYEEEE